MKLRVLLLVVAIFYPIIESIFWDDNVFSVLFLCQIYYHFLLPVFMGVLLILYRDWNYSYVYFIVYFLIIYNANYLSRYGSDTWYPIDGESKILDKLVNGKQYFIFVFFMLIYFITRIYFRTSKNNENILDELRVVGY